MLQLFDACGQRTFEKGSVLKILVNLFVEVFLSIFGKSGLFGCDFWMFWYLGLFLSHSILMG